MAREPAIPHAARIPPAPRRLLQRKCACGGTPGPTGECEDCRRKRLSLQSENHALQAGIRSDSSPGNATRAFTEPRFKHDFSRVRVQSGGERARRLDIVETPAPASTPGQSPTQPGDDPYCLHTSPGEGPERCEFTQKQQQILSFELYAARTLTSQALGNLSRRDPYMATLAKRIFHTQNADMDRIAAVTSQILDNLRSKPVVCGTCADQACYTAGVVAHVTEDLGTIILCQRFFLTSAAEMRRTLIHEAGHAAGVDSSLGDVPEVYCAEDSEGCVDPCSNLGGDLSQNVDAWARFIECAAQSG